MTKSNKVELDKRILIVSKLLLSGKVNKVIFRFASLNWGVSDRQTQNYIRACYALWFKEFKVKHLANVSYHLAKRADLYCQAYKQKDWKTCLEIAKDESKILDIYPSEKTDLRIEEKEDQDIIEKKALEKLDRILGFLSGEQVKVLMAIIEGKKEIEVSKLVEDPENKGKGKWNLIERKKPAILALEDLDYVIKNRKKIKKGGEKENGI